MSIKVTVFRVGILSAGMFVASVPTANAAIFGPSSVSYEGAVRSYGYATSDWTYSRPYITVTYQDVLSDSWNTHADGYIWAYKPQTNPVTGWTFYSWVMYHNEQFVNVNHMTNVKSTNAGLVSGATAYGSSYQVCLNIPYAPDKCNGKGMLKY